MKKYVLVVFIVITVFSSVCYADEESSTDDLWVPNTLDRIIKESVKHTTYQGYNIIKVKTVALDNNDPSLVYVNNIWIDTDNDVWILQDSLGAKEVNHQWQITDHTIKDPRDMNNWHIFDINNEYSEIAQILKTINNNNL